MSASSNRSEPRQKLVELDGSSGEGGGQILRTALTLSLLTGRPFRLSNIRANRDKPGLRPQHLKAVQTAEEIGNARTTGASAGSREVTFIPGPLVVEDRTIDIGTAGSTSLVLQTIQLPIAMRAERTTRVELIGGTFNSKAPAFSFLDETWRRFLNAFGMPISLMMFQAGFYPRGGGQVEAIIEPAQPRSYRATTRGRLMGIRGVAGFANLPGHIANRMVHRASERLTALANSTGCSLNLETLNWPSVGPGAAISLIAEHEGTIPATFVGLGERGKPAEVVADEAVDQLLAFESIEDAAVDPHSADQILLPLSVAEGNSVYTVSEVTEHLRTNADTIRAFLDRSITIEEPAGDDCPGVVTIA